MKDRPQINQLPAPGLVGILGPLQITNPEILNQRLANHLGSVLILDLVLEEALEMNQIPHQSTVETQLVHHQIGGSLLQGAQAVVLHLEILGNQLNLPIQNQLQINLHEGLQVGV